MQSKPFLWWCSVQAPIYNLTLSCEVTPVYQNCRTLSLFMWDSSVDQAMMVCAGFNVTSLRRRNQIHQDVLLAALLWVRPEPLLVLSFLYRAELLLLTISSGQRKPYIQLPQGRHGRWILSPCSSLPVPGTWIASLLASSVRSSQGSVSSMHIIIAGNVDQGTMFVITNMLSLF